MAKNKYNDVNNQQDATSFPFINLFNLALHVSGDKFPLHQEHLLTVYTVKTKLKRLINENVVASCWFFTSLC